MIVYAITNKINGKMYIGQTSRPLNLRTKEHFCLKKTGCTGLYNAITKYGRDGFDVEVLATVPNQTSLDVAEVFFIQQYNTTNSKYGYNACPGGLGGNRTTCTPVYGVNPKTGECIFLRSMTDGTRYGFTRTGLSKSMKIRGTHKGWNFYTMDDFLKLREIHLVTERDNRSRASKNVSPDKRNLSGLVGSREKRKRPVIGTCIKTGNEVEYAYTRETKKDGFLASSVARCCRGECKIHQGYTWRYAND
jgi:hypothetical protein